LFDTVAWIAEGFLALFFLAAGLPKVIGKGIDRWVGFDQVPRPMTIVIGIAEVGAAIGLVVPLLVDEAEWTTPLAALGIAVISLMASGFHLRAREWLAALETVLWASLAITIAIVRWDEFSSGPTISDGVLTAALIVLVPAVIVNLVLLARATAPAAPQSADLVEAN